MASTTPDMKPVVAASNGFMLPESPLLKGARSSTFKTSFPKDQIKILLLEGINQSAVDSLVDEGYQVETIKTLTPEELAEKIQHVHVIGIRSKTKLRKHILENAKKLLAIGHFCIGTDQTDLSFAATMGIPVFNSPFANTRSVAELVLAQSIILARKAGDRNMEMHRGQWRKTAVGCYEVRGKVMGIVGYGHVGSQLSVLAESLGFRIIYYDIIPKLPMGNAMPSPSLDALLRDSDFVTLHVPYTQETHMMIGEAELSTMKKGSYLMNAARGKCVDIDAVAKYLKSGHLGGAYFDVYPTEPIDQTLVLRECPNCTMTPHIGGSTQEAQRGIGVEVADKLARFVNEGRTIAAVNFPEIGLPPNPSVHRIINIHRNVPGVLKSINGILADYNVSAQVLRTNQDVGYCVVEVDADKDLSQDVKEKMDALESTIRTRVLYGPGHKL